MIVLDPGHPSREGDRGKVAGSFQEYLFTWEVAQSVGAILSTHRVPWTLTRGPDQVRGLAARGDIGRRFDADLAVSIHANAAHNHDWQGMIAFHNGKGMAEHLAQEILRRAPQELWRAKNKLFKARPLGWTRRSNNVLRHHDCAAVLVECGFATNNADRTYLNTELGQFAIANSIVGGLLEFAKGVA